MKLQPDPLPRLRRSPPLLAAMILTPILLIGALRPLWADSPFHAVSQTHLGAPFVRPAYDLQPSILYDLEESIPARRFKMWWLGQHPTESPADRIYYAESADGSAWSVPAPVLAPQLGASGTNAADDHLLGSPTVLKRNSKYYMFYEAYGNWVTAVNRLYSFARGDNWTTHGAPQCEDALCTIVNPDWDPSYDRPERAVHGFAPRLRKARTHPVYSGEVRYANGQKYNRFLRLTPTPVRLDPNGEVWRRLNQGQPVFWLFDAPGEGRTPLYSFWDSANRNTFTSTNANAEGVSGAVPDFVDGNSHILGYVASTLEGPDMVGSLQNRVLLATSSDGRNWTRFAGAARDGAVLAPQNELTSKQGFPPPACAPAHERWDIHRSYGSGYPASTIRDGFLELHFTDDSPTFASQPCAGLPVWRVRIPVAEIENAQAYLRAPRQPNALAGDDFKWSPLFRRYFAITFRPTLNGTGVINSQVPALVWSERDPNPANPPTFPQGNELLITLPAGRWGAAGGILGDGNGNTVDFFSPAVSESYSALHLFYEEMPAGDLSVFSRDFGHTLVFGYPPVELKAPTIVAEPNSQTVNEGSDVTFTVSAQGAGPLFFQWSKNNSAVAGATNASISIMGARPVDSGTYRVVVSNAVGTTTSQAATLTVRIGQSLVLTNFVRLPNGAVQFRVLGPSEQVCVVERSPDNLSWIPIGSLRLTDGKGEFAEVTPSGSALNFYRAAIRTNSAPTVIAPSNISLKWRGAVVSVDLNGQLFDDGLPSPPGRVASAWTHVSGPAPVSFSDSTTPVTRVALSAPGVYRLRLTANDSTFISTRETVINLEALDSNLAPSVNGGPDLSLVLPTTASLEGVVSDDGLPDPPRRFTVAWSKASGPGTVVFANSNAARTTASFSAVGMYRLWLTAFDGSKWASNDVIVTVIANQPPTVAIGADQSVTLPDPTAPNVQPPAYIDFRPLLHDDGLPNPPARLSGQWSHVSGPQVPGFGAPSGMNFTAITNRIYFSVAGNYALRLEVTDGALRVTNTVSVRVFPPTNAAPNVSAGPSQTIDLPDAALLNGFSSDDGLPTPPGRLTNHWSQVSGPNAGTVLFANAAQAQTTASFSLPGNYRLRLTAGDGEESRSATTEVTVKSAREYLAVYEASNEGCGIGGQEYRIRNSNTRRSIRYVVVITYSTAFAGNYQTSFSGTVAAGSTRALECIDPPGDPGGRTSLGTQITSANF